MGQLLILIQVEDVLLIVGTLSEKAWRNDTDRYSLAHCCSAELLCFTEVLLTCGDMNVYITNLSLHRKPLQDFVFWRHLGVIFSKTPVNKFAGLVLQFVFFKKGFLSLEKMREKLVYLYPLTPTHIPKVPTRWKTII